MQVARVRRLVGPDAVEALESAKRGLGASPRWVINTFERCSLLACRVAHQTREAQAGDSRGAARSLGRAQARNGIADLSPWRTTPPGLVWAMTAKKRHTMPGISPGLCMTI